jgi:TolB-like protein
MPVQTFLAELKRRKVFRVAVAYAVVGWLIIQFSTTVFPHLQIPDWATRLVLMLVLLGFPIALILAWALELTPEGVRLTHAVDQQLDRQVPAAHWGLKRHALAYLAVAAVGGLVVFASQRWWQPALQGATATTASVAGDDRPAPIPGNKSIAVLPFVNMSDDKANEHFGDGLSEELLNLLAKEPGLRVAARTSSFSFKGKDATIGEVAKALQVDSVLEGSVRRQGNTVRVVAQLISASDGTHLWSEKYDREMSDIFAVQDDIADNIIKALKPHLMAGSSAASRANSGSISPALFERFLRGRAKFRSPDRASVKQAHEDFQSITREAPDYAPAHAWLALSWLNLPDTPDTVSLPAAQQEVERALKLDANEAVAYLAQGSIHQRRDNDNAKAMASLDRALEINPAMVEAHLDRQWLLASTGRGAEAVQELEVARKIDPLHPDVLRDLSHLLNLQGKRREAFALIDQLRVLDPTMAMEAELHLYSDNQEPARGAYIASRYLEADPGSEVALSWLTGFNQSLGLNHEIATSKDDRRYLALAVLGRNAEADAAAAKLLAETKDPADRTLVTYSLHMARGNLDAAEKVLLDAWRANTSGVVGNEFGVYEAISLVALLTRDGHRPPADEVTTAFEKQVSGYSPLHQAGTLQFQFWLAHFRGRKDEAAKILDKLAASGFQGRWGFGKAFPQTWVFDAEPLYAPVLERILANHVAQLRELDRLRRSGMSVAQARADFLASHQAPN